MDALAQGTIYRIPGRTGRKQVKNAGGIGNGTAFFGGRKDAMKQQGDILRGFIKEMKAVPGDAGC